MNVSVVGATVATALFMLPTVTTTLPAGMNASVMPTFVLVPSVTLTVVFAATIACVSLSVTSTSTLTVGRPLAASDIVVLDVTRSASSVPRTVTG